MPPPSNTISKDPKLLPSEDYYFLRSKGIELIEKMGSSLWTDYNNHDPGITLLEALCFAITEIGYHAGRDIKDILAVPPNVIPNQNIQALFSPQEILSCNPLTPNDYRKILIDQQDIRNAWLVCKKCACEVQLFADCEESSLSFKKTEVKVTPLGTYDLLLELEQDPDLGDLNNQKVLHSFSIILGDGTIERVTMELRFPIWNELEFGDFYSREVNGDIMFNFPWNNISVVNSIKLSRNKADNFPITQEELRNGWNGVFYTTLEVYFNNGPISPISFENISIRLYGNEEVRSTLIPGKVMAEASSIIGDGAIIKRYFRKMERVATTIDKAKKELHKVRNLCEDFCCTSRVNIEDIAVCADIEVTAEADIERVMANILFEIEQYFNPAVRFFSLSELMVEGKPIDQIFEGPVLNHGFILEEDLEKAQLKNQLQISDIINRLADLDGVNAVKNLMLTKYDADGNPVFGVSDHGDPNQISAKWTMMVSDRCQPRLYIENSKILFFKNDLPFLARTDEVQDTLAQLRGKSERLKIQIAENALKMPQGVYHDQKSYYPVQYSLPMNYGIGLDGLSDNASDKRKAQAKQLKAFLLFFEQLLSNQLAQIANIGSLFALDKSISNTYYTKELFHEEIVKGVTDLMDSSLLSQKLQRLVETEADFLDRRNRFLDHLLGRFSESFTDYALALFSYIDQKPLAQKQLIDNKIDFLSDYPVISRERARAINYKNLPDPASNFPGLRKRIARLLGLDSTTEEQILIIEHILLRPKFQGDALMQVCLDKNCSSCNETDTYSFQMTVVMPGWVAPFDTNLDLRRFAERTIRLETPAHILLKICWVGNQGDKIEQCEPIVSTLAQLIMEEAKTSIGNSPECVDASICASWLFGQYFKNFIKWTSENPVIIQQKNTETQITLKIQTLIQGIVFDNSLAADCDVDFIPLRSKIDDLMISHFANLVLKGFQYDKLKYRWDAWLLENRQFEWCELNLRTKINSLLNKVQILDPNNFTCYILEIFGNAFYKHLETLMPESEGELIINAASEINAIFNQVFPGDSIQLNGYNNIEGKIFANLKTLFLHTYEHLFSVTIKLRDLLNLFSKLNSVYPLATLHDCDDGSDVNPVRLDNTALGGNI